MTKTQVNKLSQEIEDISGNFETEPWTDNIKLLREDFDVSTLKPAKHYSDVLYEMNELLREARVLFLYSVFNKVCHEEGVSYPFGSPYRAGMTYNAVMKKEGSFYILDEDGDAREIFTNEKFTRFVDDLYWELIDE